MSINIDQQILNINAFIQQVFGDNHKTKAVIAVSGGIDSALSLTLTVQALGADRVFPIFLPYADQDMADAQLIADWNKIPQANQRTIQIKPIVDQLALSLSFNETEDEKIQAIRLGNLKARARMICVFDLARQIDALVGGTENKSEKYLGYFTRFGDAASDYEPITNLYKTEVRLMAQQLGLPAIFWEKAPSAGLWPAQTDEQELGFSYHDADLVLQQLIDQKKLPATINIPGLSSTVVKAVLDRVNKVAFKLQVPYCPPVNQD